MRKAKYKNIICSLVILVSLFMLTSCMSEVVDIQDIGKPLSDYTEEGFKGSVYIAENAEGKNEAYIDVSNANRGYVGVSVVSDKRVKFQVITDDITYNYDVPNDGIPAIYPLQSGDGEYKLRVMKNVTESKYSELYTKVINVDMISEFEPFIRPNLYVHYSEDSECVKLATELTKDRTDDIGKVAEIYLYIIKNITYDKVKAQNVQSGYISDPDETLRTKKGICFDYASLAAAMLRSQGIPTKLIFGYVSPENVYHAWNMFYVKEKGWITVNFEAKEDGWNKVDLTFSASTADGFKLIDSNYSDVYYY